MRAREVMSSPVITVRRETPIGDAAALLTSHGFTALPVVDDSDAVVGIVTEADLLRDRIHPDPRGLIWDGDPDRPPAPGTVGEVMSLPGITVAPGADAADMAKAMLRSHIRCIPVIDGDTLVGVVTRRDMVRGIARGDAEIAADVRHQLEIYGGPDRWTVRVRHGAVSIVDEFDDTTDAHVATVLAESVPGVEHAEVTHRAN